MNRDKIVRHIKEYWAYYILLIVLLFEHSFIHLINGDDVSYSKQMVMGTDLINNLYSRYMMWSSRVIIEYFMYLTVQSEILWKAINIAMYLLLMYSLDSLIVCKDVRYKRGILLFVLLLFPLRDMNSAGWVATTTGYFWTIALGSYGLLAVKKTILGEKICVWEKVLYLLAILYAANHEQMMAVLLIIYTIVIVKMIIEKRKAILVVLQYCIILGNTFIILLSPGNASRQNTVRIEACPDYFIKSPIRLFYESYANAMNYLLFDRGLTLFALLCVLAFGIWRINRNRLVRFGTLIPIFYVILGHINKFPSSIEFLFRHSIVIGVENAMSRREYIAIVFSAIILGFVIGELFIIFGNTLPFWISTILLGSGLVCKIALGTTGSAFTVHLRRHIVHCHF